MHAKAKWSNLTCFFSLIDSRPRDSICNLGRSWGCFAMPRLNSPSSEWDLQLYMYRNSTGLSWWSLCVCVCVCVYFCMYEWLSSTCAYVGVRVCVRVRVRVRVRGYFGVYLLVVWESLSSFPPCFPLPSPPFLPPPPPPARQQDPVSKDEWRGSRVFTLQPPLRPFPLGPSSWSFLRCLRLQCLIFAFFFFIPCGCFLMFFFASFSLFVILDLI